MSIPRGRRPRLKTPRHGDGAPGGLDGHGAEAAPVREAWTACSRRQQAFATQWWRSDRSGARRAMAAARRRWRRVRVGPVGGPTAQLCGKRPVAAPPLPNSVPWHRRRLSPTGRHRNQVFGSVTAAAYRLLLRARGSTWWGSMEHRDGDRSTRARARSSRRGSGARARHARRGACVPRPSARRGDNEQRGAGLRVQASRANGSIDLRHSSSMREDREVCTRQDDFHTVVIRAR